MKTRDREEFIAQCVVNSNGAGLQQTLKVARALMRLAAKADRYATARCNGGWGESPHTRQVLRPWNEADEQADSILDAKGSELATSMGWSLRTSGDPRGYVWKLAFPNGAYNTWGGKEDGWGIPS